MILEFNNFIKMKKTTQMRITYKHLLIVLAGYLIYFLFKNVTIVDIPVKKMLLEKVVSSDRHGNAYYNYKWQLENGEIEYNTRSFESSRSYELGKTYLFNEQKIKLK